MNDISGHAEDQAAVEDCDCPRCALTYRDCYKAALKNAMETIGMLRDAPTAVSAEVDFESLTWKFRIKSDCQVGPGTYALVKLSSTKTTGDDE